MALQNPLIPTPVNYSNAATPAPAVGLTTADLALAPSFPGLQRLR